MIEESIDDDEEISETACFTSRVHIEAIIHFNIPVEYPSTSPEVVATIFHIAGWADPKTMIGKIYNIL